MDSSLAKQFLFRICAWSCGIIVFLFISDVRTDDSGGNTVIVIGVNSTNSSDSSNIYGYIYYLYPGDYVGIAFGCLAIIMILICCVCIGMRQSARRQQMMAQQNANNAAMYNSGPRTVAIVRTTQVPRYDINGPTVVQYSQVNPSYYPGQNPYGDHPPIPPYSPPMSYGNQNYPSNLPPSYEAQSQQQQQQQPQSTISGEQQDLNQQLAAPVGKFY